MNTEPATRTPAAKPKLAARPTVIYCFTWAAGSGGVYVGKRTPPASCNVAEWPTSGTGRLPCGYGGSGNVIRAARAKHPEEAFSWRILEVVPEGGNYAEAEARWVAWAKEAHPEVCRNLSNGGDGWDSETARQLTREQWQDPEYRQRISESAREQLRELWQNPEYRARASEQNKLNSRAAWANPEYRQRISESMSEQLRGQWQNPEFRQRVSEAVSEQNRAAWATPETRALWHRAALQKRLSAATKRRNLGQPPLPLDNLCLEAFDEPRNQLPCVPPREPRSEELLGVLEALRQHPEGLTAPALCELLGRPEYGPGGVRNALDNLRERCHQPILNDGGTFILLPEGSY